MELSKKLIEQGWHLTEDGLKRMSTESTDLRKIIAAALDMDFRDIAGGALPAKRDDSSLPGRIVLQVQRVRNISAPKANEESRTAPRFLQLDLSDGQSLLQALELEPVPSLSLNLQPGTKIYFCAERLQLMQGYLVLRANELQVLGGRVEALVEKWELARAMQQYARSGRRVSGASGPPPWIKFGKKIEGLKDTMPQDRKFRSLLAAIEKDKDEVKENEEFNAMRSEAIAEATKAGAKKIFGGGGQQILDHNVKKILEKGYSEEDAKLALRNTNNNLERALYNLKRRQDYRQSDELVKPGGARGGYTREMGGGRRERGAASLKEEAAAAKPATNVSLFDFLTDKLPANTDAAPTASSTQATASQSTYSTSTTQRYEKPRSDYTKSSYNTKPATEASSSSRPKFENNISSSFAANRTTSSGSQRGGRTGGDYNERESGYNAGERRYANNRGAGGRGRGGASSSSATGRDATSYEDNNRGGTYQATRPGNPFAGNARGGNRSGQYERGAQESAAAAPAPATTTTTTTYDNRRGNNERGRGGAGGGGNYENRSYDKTRFNQRESGSRNYDANRAPNTYNNNATTSTHAVAAVDSGSGNNNNNNERINKLVESTAKLRLDKGREQQSGGNNRQQQQRQRATATTTTTQQQQTQQQQQQATHKQYSQPQYANSTGASTAAAQPAAAPYLPAATSPPQPQQQQQQQQHQQHAYAQLPNGFTYDPSKIIGFQSKETNEFAMTLLQSQGAAAAQQQQQPLHAYVPAAASPLQPQTAYGAATYMLPSPPAPGRYGMIGGDAWMWKIGDLCLAKYWDDGNYYDAEITAVSDTTCVVFFLNYGNHEEVLKSDCLPVTDANHQPINSYGQLLMQQQQQQQQPSPMQSHAFQRGGGAGGGGNQRYRGERQMYVPPHKRDN